MSNILHDITQWSESLPYWERAALDKILSSKALAEDDYDELLGYLLEERGTPAKGAKARQTSILKKNGEEAL